MKKLFVLMTLALSLCSTLFSLEAIKLSLPIQTDYRISKSFELYKNPLNNSQYNLHSGIDFAIPSGTSIFAANEGTVYEIGNNNQDGKYIIINHSDSYFTKYSHLSEILCSIDSKVTIDTEIAHSGNTGLSTGPHLCFSLFIKHNNKLIAINPTEYFTDLDQTNKTSNILNVLSLEVPVRTKCKISLPYGRYEHPISKSQSYHHGCDFSAPINTLVYAAMDGYVSETGYNDNDGNFILVNHNNGLFTRYCHLKSIISKPNEKVTTKTPLGRLGATGLVTGPVLCFRLEMKDGTTLDPFPFFHDSKFLTAIKSNN